jgi:cell division protein FtsQ
MDPRIRRRRVEVRRSEGRRRLRLLVLALVVAGLTAGGWLVLHSPLLAVARIDVEGATRTGRASVVSSSGIERGAPMLQVDQAGAGRRIEALPWVSRAEVRRSWPKRVSITVVERHPSAVSRTDSGNWALIDGTGRVLDWLASAPPELLLLEGVGPVPQPGSALEGAAGPLRVVAALTPPLASRATAVVAVQGGDVEVKLNPRGTVRLGTPDNLPAKVRAAETVLAQVDVHNLDALDVRLPSSPVLTRG